MLNIIIIKAFYKYFKSVVLQPFDRNNFDQKPTSLELRGRKTICFVKRRKSWRRGSRVMYSKMSTATVRTKALMSTICLQIDRYRIWVLTRINWSQHCKNSQKQIKVWESLKILNQRWQNNSQTKHNQLLFQAQTNYLRRYYHHRYLINMRGNILLIIINEMNFRTIPLIPWWIQIHWEKVRRFGNQILSEPESTGTIDELMSNLSIVMTW